MNEWTDSTEYMLHKRLEGRGCCVELREGIAREGSLVDVESQQELEDKSAFSRVEDWAQY